MNSDLMLIASGANWKYCDLASFGSRKRRTGTRLTVTNVKLINYVEEWALIILTIMISHIKFHGHRPSNSNSAYTIGYLIHNIHRTCTSSN